MTVSRRPRRLMAGVILAALAAACTAGASDTLGGSDRLPQGPPPSATTYADPIEGVDPLGARVYPHVYVDISQQIEKKRQMLSFHASQRHWLREHHGMDEYLDRMTEWAVQRGAECGFAYAEGLRQHLGHAPLGLQRFAIGRKLQSIREKRPN